jgi:phospholipase C
VHKTAIRSLWAFLLFICVAACAPNTSLAQTGLKKANHIIIVMQENRSFDNYFGALPYAPGTPYHSPSGTDGCDPNDHRCVDGLSCLPDATGALHCFNSNLDDNGSQPFPSHLTASARKRKIHLPGADVSPQPLKMLR